MKNQRERERDRETERDRDRDRQTDRDRERHRERQTETDRDRETETETETNLLWLRFFCLFLSKALVRLVSRGISVRIRFGSPFFSKAVVRGHCLVTLSLKINETLN